MSAGRTPTPEQQKIIDAYVTKEDLVIEAGAGTGKTTTLKMLATATPRRTGTYIAYNKAIAQDAKRDFPSNVMCSTAHGLAYRAVGSQYRHRLDGGRVPAAQAARILRINEPLKVGDKILSPTKTTYLVMETVKRFCNSNASEITGKHIPSKPGLDSDGDMRVLRTALVPLARRAWEDLTRRDGRLRFEHRHYLKIWELSKPRLPVDYVLLDEAQDANPVIASIVESQDHAQRIMVGDRNQAIYGWNGAIDAMANFLGQRLQLSQSFRFGAAIADEANKWLSWLGADLRLSGFERINSVVESADYPDAILCRTNAEALGQAMSAMRDGIKVALVGGGAGLRRMAEAAISLKAGLGTDHPELLAFASWGQVQDYVQQDPDAEDLAGVVNLIDEFGPDRIIEAVDQLSNERYAKLIVSTAHKAKGREWETVLIAPDFREPKPNEDGSPGAVSDEEAMLSYVAVTRAKLVLDRGPLKYIDSRLGITV